MTPEQFKEFMRHFDIAVECLIQAPMSNDGYNSDREQLVYKYRKLIQNESGERIILDVVKGRER